ncbi:MAG: NAD-glutamate dehydrogenase, partial [Steroidobacteraceae bacterium]
FAAAIPHHRLRREIIVTATANSLVNRMGPLFAHRAAADTGAAPARIARAYTAAREIFGMRATWSAIEALDGRVPPSLQYELLYETSRLLRHAAYWLLARHATLAIDLAVARYATGVRELAALLPASLTGSWRERFDAAHRRAVEAGVPTALAARVAGLDALDSALDVVELTLSRRIETRTAAQAYFELGARTSLDWARGEVDRLSVDGAWQAAARRELRHGLERAHRHIADQALARRPGRGKGSRVDAWMSSAGAALARWQSMAAEMRAAGKTDFATLSVALETVRKLAE